MSEIEDGGPAYPGEGVERVQVGDLLGGRVKKLGRPRVGPGILRNPFEDRQELLECSLRLSGFDEDLGEHEVSPEIER